MKSLSLYSIILVLMGCFLTGCLLDDEEETPIGPGETNNDSGNSNNNNITGNGNTQGLKGIEVAISTEAFWFDQDIADREMNILANNINGKVKSVLIFVPELQNQLATWVASRTNDNKIDVLVLCGVFPDSIYKAENLQPNGSIAEKFLDAGNMIVNTGDYIFFTTSKEGSSNLDLGLQNMTDAEIDMWTGGYMEPTKEAEKYLPTYTVFSSGRSFNTDKLIAPWVPEVLFGQDNERSDPAVIRNKNTNGRIAIFYQVEWPDEDLPRGQVMSEFILNWLPTVLLKP